MNKSFQSITKWLLILCAIIYFSMNSGAFSNLSLEKEINYWHLLLYLLFSCCNRAFNAYRIKQIVLLLAKSSNLNLFSSLRVLLFSEFVSVLIPTTYSAEAVRLVKLTKYNISLKQSSLAILIDRGTGFVFLCAMTLLVFFLSDPFIVLNEIIDAELAWIVSISIVSLVVLLLVVFYCLREIRAKIFDIFVSLFTLKNVIDLFVTSLFVYVSAVGFYYYAFVIANADISSEDVVFIVFLSFISRLVPFSVFGVSAGDLVLVVVAGYFGVTQDQALVTVMVVIMGKYLFSIFGFLLELYCDGVDVVRKSISGVK